MALNHPIMKKAMSNVDVAAVAEELREQLVGGFLGKAYQLSPDRVVFSFQSASLGKKDLVLEAGRRVHLTEKPRKAPQMPPQFPTVLRQRISGGRISAVNQHDFDRVLEIVVERADGRYLLIAEMFPKGNVLLTDESGRIILPLRPMAFRNRRLLAGEDYLYREGQVDPRTVSREDLATIVSQSDADIVRTLVRNLNMGGIYGEEVCLRAGLEKDRTSSTLDEEEIDRLYEALKDVFVISPENVEPQIVSEDGVPKDVIPTSLRVYDGMEKKVFPSFSQALDEFFAEDGVVEGSRPKTALERREEMQERSIEDFSAKEREYARCGDLIYERYGEIESILNAISNAMEKGYTYSEIWARIKTSGLPVAEKLLSLNYQGEVKLLLDEGGPELELNANLTIPQNAQRYYDRSKEQTRKKDGAEKALEVTKKLIAKKAAPKPKTRRVLKRRKPRWFERFRWFHSSDGFLVIGGKDANSNEEIYAKYLEKRDFALHTDAPGAPLVVIKTEGKEVPETTLEEAAQFAVSYSSVWKAGLFEGDCYLVAAEQVTKTPESGEFLRKGAFVIRGERRYFKDVPTGLAIGIFEDMLIGGPVSAVKAKSNPVVEIEPGEFSPDDLAKRIYRTFAEKVDDRRYLKSVASTEQIVSFLPPGGSRAKE